MLPLLSVACGMCLMSATFAGKREKDMDTFTGLPEEDWFDAERHFPEIQSYLRTWKGCQP